VKFPSASPTWILVHDVEILTPFLWQIAVGMILLAVGVELERRK
jgi:hypothetical protein